MSSRFNKRQTYDQRSNTSARPRKRRSTKAEFSQLSEKHESEAQQTSSSGSSSSPSEDDEETFDGDNEMDEEEVDSDDAEPDEDYEGSLEEDAEGDLKQKVEEEGGGEVEVGGLQPVRILRPCRPARFEANRSWMKAMGSPGSTEQRMAKSQENSERKPKRVVSL